MPNLFIVDVGHGNSSVLVDTKGVVVIDAGPRSDLLDFLKANRINKVDALLLSHADKDHIGGAISLLASTEVNINSVYLNSDSIKKSEIWKDLVYALYDSHKRKKLKFEPSLTSNLNDQLHYGEVDIEILAPNHAIAAISPGGEDRKGRKLTSNSISAVIRLSYRGKRIAFLPGDIDRVGFENLLEDYPDGLQSWLTVYPHHGGKATSDNNSEFAARFCEIVKPEVVVFSVRDNVKHYPTVEVVRAVTATLKNVRMLSTRTSSVLFSYIEDTGQTYHQNCVGHICLDFNRQPLEIQTMGRFDM